MISKLRKYRQFLFLTLSACYMLGVLEMPLLEVLHSLSHTSSLISGNYHQHSYKHHNLDHSHDLLQAYASLNPGETDQPNHSIENDKKKKVEKLDAVSMIQPKLLSRKLSILFYVRDTKDRYLNPECPPPEIA